MNREESKLVTASIPRLDDLRCITGRINPTKYENSPLKDLYNRRIVYCRLLTFSFPEIIATPSTKRDINDIYILLKTEFLLSGRLQRKLEDLKIEYFESTKEKTLKIYESCLRYTMLSKLCPQWNKLAEYLVQGKDFLTSLDNPTNAIYVDIVMSAEETRLYLSPVRCKIPRLSLDHFSLPRQTIDKFLADDDGVIVLEGLNSNIWVYVMPSLARGKVYSITKKRPNSCPFKDYAHLQQHWFNLWGFRLPETDTGMIYYQIKFPGFGYGPHTYPDCCVRPEKLKFLRGNNKEEITGQFIKDLTIRMPKVCNTTLVLEESTAGLELQKENIPVLGLRQTQNAVRICNGRESGNYIPPLDIDDKKLVGYRNALFTPFDNPTSSKLGHNVIKDKNLREALNMKPFLRVQSANRRGSIASSDDFFPKIGNPILAKGSNIFELASNLYKEKQRSRELSSSEYMRKAEAIGSSRSVKSDTDKSLTVNKTSEENASFYDSLLQRRSSFDLNDFGRDLGLKTEETGSKGPGLETRSHYFENIEHEGGNNEKVLKPVKNPSSKLKLHRLSDRKKLPTAKVSSLKSERKDRFTVEFKIRDISSYFKERKQVKVSKLPETLIKKSMPKLIQTQLNFKKSEQVQPVNSQ